jgi:ferritin-like metal-binding protein YciE
LLPALPWNSVEPASRGARWGCWRAGAAHAACEQEEVVMGLFSKDIKSMEDLYEHTLQDVYYAENQIAKSLPDMIEKATNPQLRAGFEKHLKETDGQIARLEQVFEMLEAEAEGDKCPAIDGILKEGSELMGEIDDEDVMNVGLIAAAQAVEHYEITRYGTLVAWAKLLGHSSAAKLLAANLKEEKATDKKLNSIAMRKINKKALAKSRADAKKAKKNGKGEDASLMAMMAVPGM